MTEPLPAEEVFNEKLLAQLLDAIDEACDAYHRRFGTMSGGLVGPIDAEILDLGQRVGEYPNYRDERELAQQEDKEAILTGLLMERTECIAKLEEQLTAQHELDLALIEQQKEEIARLRTALSQIATGSVPGGLS